MFSINRALDTGFRIGNEGVIVKLMKDCTTLMFNGKLKTKNDFISEINMVPVINQVPDTTMESKKGSKLCSIVINKLHKTLGHCGESLLKCTEKTMALLLQEN